MGPEDNLGRIKSAASLLLKGGTLTGDPCPKCGGVQVRFADMITCINCGNEEKPDVKQVAGPEKADRSQGSADLGSVALIIEEKIAVLVSEIKVENDILAQKQKAELLENYLRILEKVRSILG